MKPVVLLAVPDIDRARQWEACLTFAASHGLKVVCLADTPAVAASVVDAGTADEVLAVVPLRGPEPGCLAGRVRYVRPTRGRSEVDLLDQLGDKLLKNQPVGVSQADLQAALDLVRHALNAPATTRTGPRPGVAA